MYFSLNKSEKEIEQKVLNEIREVFKRYGYSNDVLPMARNRQKNKRYR
jgi:histidyl-tRNA synthetase